LDDTIISQFESSLILSYNDDWLVNYGSTQEITDIEALKGYIIYSDTYRSISFSGPVYSDDYLLSNNNWNLVGVSREGYFSEIYPEYSNYEVYSWRYGEVVEVSGEMLELGKAYFVGVDNVIYSPIMGFLEKFLKFFGIDRNLNSKGTSFSNEIKNKLKEYKKES